MPIWADFMREALNLNPEWNGDWKMPENIRKAEIDTAHRQSDPRTKYGRSRFGQSAAVGSEKR